jgi:hypothetical protein
MKNLHAHADVGMKAMVTMYLSHDRDRRNHIALR